MEKRNLRLLILDDSPNEAENYAVIFRNAGYATRLHRITSIEDAEKVLEQTWDLVISAPVCENLEPEKLLELITSKKLDIPYIQQVTVECIQDESAVMQFLNKGAHAVFSIDSDPAYLLLIAVREVNNLFARRQLHYTEKLLLESERRCHLLLDSSIDAIAYIHDGMHIYINNAYVQLFGYTDKAEMESLPIIDLVQSDNPNDLKELFKHRVEASLACYGLSKSGKKIPITISTSPANYDGEACIQVIIRKEIEASIDSEMLQEKLREISSQDAVTGLYNRAYLPTLIDRALDKVALTNMSYTLLYIQIDKFDTILSQVGIAGSDTLLSDFADLLKESFNNDEELARFSDDTFVILVPERTSAELMPVLQALIETISHRLFEINDFSIQITSSIGVADFDTQVAAAQEILDRAHHCIDDIPEGNAIKVYDPAEALAVAASRGDLLATLQQTLQQESLNLLYQPVVSLHGKTFELYEARLRMLDANGKELPLLDLLNVASESGMIEQIDRWIVVNALKKVAKMRVSGANPRVIIQISAETLRSETLYEWLKKLFAATKLPSDCLIVEFTENNAATYLKQSQTLIAGLKTLGCQTVLTDFGKTANSMLSLTHLPVDFVKISPSFVQALRKQEGVDVLTDLLAQLKKEKFKTIVPFVETASILSILWQAGADYIQGYYLQRPMDNMGYDFSSGQ